MLEAFLPDLSAPHKQAVGLSLGAASQDAGLRRAGDHGRDCG